MMGMFMDVGSCLFSKAGEPSRPPTPVNQNKKGVHPKGIAEKVKKAPVIGDGPMPGKLQVGE